MTKLFYQGGILFMGTLSVILLLILIIGILNFYLILKGNSSDVNIRLSRLKSLGLFAFIFGILGQLIGLYDAFIHIQKVGNVSPNILAGGIKVSMITTIYGTIIFLTAYLFWFGLVFFADKKFNNKSWSSDANNMK